MMSQEMHFMKYINHLKYYQAPRLVLKSQKNRYLDWESNHDQSVNR